MGARVKLYFPRSAAESVVGPLFTQPSQVVGLEEVPDSGRGPAGAGRGPGASDDQPRVPDLNVAIPRDGTRVPVPPLLVETDEERRISEEAHARRAERIKNDSTRSKVTKST